MTSSVGNENVQIPFMHIFMLKALNKIFGHILHMYSTEFLTLVIILNYVCRMYMSSQENGSKPQAVTIVNNKRSGKVSENENNR